MLYVSRYIGQHEYGIVDTDDEVEEIVNFDFIRERCIRHNIAIQGVDPYYFQKSAGKVFLYQPPEAVSQAQLKLKMLCRINLKVYKSIITSIDWKISDIVAPVSLRLSDFGTSCADFVLDSVGKILADLILNAKKYSARNRVTIILDDKLTYSPRSFWIFGYDSSVINRINVIFDLHELSDDNARIVYKMLFPDLEAIDCTNIVDDKARMKAMRRMLSGG